MGKEKGQEAYRRRRHTQEEAPGEGLQNAIKQGGEAAQASGSRLRGMAEVGHRGTLEEGKKARTEPGGRTAKGVMPLGGSNREATCSREQSRVAKMAGWRDSRNNQARPSLRSGRAKVGRGSDLLEGP